MVEGPWSITSSTSKETDHLATRGARGGWAVICPLWRTAPAMARGPLVPVPSTSTTAPPVPALSPAEPFAALSPPPVSTDGLAGGDGPSSPPSRQSLGPWLGGGWPVLASSPHYPVCVPFRYPLQCLPDRKGAVCHDNLLIPLIPLPPPPQHHLATPTLRRWPSCVASRPVVPP